MNFRQQALDSGEQNKCIWKCTKGYPPFIYVNNTLSYVLTGEGFVVNRSGTPEYHYYLKDHLGNTRFTFYYNGTTLVQEQTEDYYPFGLMLTQNNLDKNKYLYNGKEIQNEFFENYDYGARFYNPQIGRWHTADPLAENYHSITPYSYCLGNPVNYTDPFGLDVWNTSDPAQIEEFCKALKNGQSTFTVTTSDWQHESDKDFLNSETGGTKTGLTYNSKTGMFIYQYGTEENNVFVLHWAEFPNMSYLTDSNSHFDPITGYYSLYTSNETRSALKLFASMSG